MSTCAHTLPNPHSLLATLFRKRGPLAVPTPDLDAAHTLVELQVEGLCRVGVDVGLRGCRVTNPSADDLAIPWQQQATRQAALTNTIQVRVLWNAGGQLDKLILEKEAAREQGGTQQCGCMSTARLGAA